ncbi:hypothetical protein L7F22_052759 [Adiantum nelumboides]|nr:hypothetical protein [Adiantum nelumboides]
MDVIVQNGHQRSRSEPQKTNECEESKENEGKVRLLRRFSSQPTQHIITDPSSSKAERVITEICNSGHHYTAERSPQHLKSRIPLRRRTQSSTTLVQRTNPGQNVRARSMEANLIAAETPRKIARPQSVERSVGEAEEAGSTSKISENHNRSKPVKDTIGLEHSLSKDDALLQFAFSPPKRSFRQRKPAQLAPYTTEMERYKRRLVRNDWEDAVVINRELMRAARVERMNAKGSTDLPEDKSHPEQSRRRSISKEVDNTTKKSRKSLNPIDQNRINQRHEQNLGLAEIHNEVIPDLSATPTTDSQSISTPFKDVPDQSRMTMLKRKRYRILSESDDNDDLRAKDVTHNTIENDEDVEEMPRQDEVPMPTNIDTDDSSTTASAASWSNERQQRNAKLRDRDYASLLKMLRKTMPARMAREYIEDLKAMDQEIQLLPADEGVHNNDALSSKDPNDDLTQELLPGQSKKRQRKDTDLRNERFKLIGDSEDEDESSEASSVSVISESSRSTIASSRSEVSRASESFSVEGGGSIHRKRHKSLSKYERRSIEPQSRVRKGVPKKSAALNGKDDAIDRMLCSSRVVHKKHQIRERRSGPVDKVKQRKPPTSRTSENRKSKDTSSNKKKNRGGGKLTDGVGRAPANPFGNVNSLSYIREARPYDKRQGIRPLLQDEDLFLPYDSALEKRVALDKAGSANEPPKRAVEAWIADVDNFRQSEQITPLRTPKHTGMNDKLSAPNLHDLTVSPIEGRSKQTSLSRFTERPQVENTVARQRMSPGTPTTDIEHQRFEAELWSSVGLVRLDFDISHPDIGIRCNPEGYIGRGRLFSLLHSSERRNATDFVDSHVNYDFPDIKCTWQNLLSTIQRSILAGNNNSSSLLCCLDDICDQYTAFANSSRTTNRLQQALDAFDQLITLARHEDQLRSIRDAQGTILSKLQWFKVEMLFLAIASRIDITMEEPQMSLSYKDAFLQSCQDLMVTLLVHGLHRTMSSMRHAKPTDSQEAGSILSFDDWSLECWICLIHVLQSDRAKEMDMNNTPFWNIFEASLKIYHNALRDAKKPFIVAENAWYSIFAICAISCISPTTGSCTIHSALQKPCWSLVSQAISTVKLRFEERVEALMSKTAIRARDQYVHLLLRRILLLTHKWKWPLENVEQLLTKLFSIFNANRLQDLPSESNHDFPHSLREFDMQILYSDTIFGDETAFQIFLRILSVAVDRARLSNNSDRQSMDKLASRILSRFSPMRSLRFAPDNVPTSLERSALFNHYSIALLYLFFVPSSEHQRLLQVQQYLNIGKADQKSQMVGVRAVMYAAIILRHHDRPIDTAMTWFKSMFVHMLNLFQHLHSKLASANHTSKSSINRELTSRQTVLMACLRAVHYILQKNSIDSSNVRTSATDINLLNPAWTNDLYDIFYLINYPQVVFESLRLISSHFNVISSNLQSTRSKPQNSKSNNDESQESYSELFEDLDFDNEALLEIAGYGPEKGQVAKVAEDRTSVHRDTKDGHVYEQLSSALFKMINIIGKPENASSFGFSQFGGNEKAQGFGEASTNVDKERREMLTDAEGEHKAQIGKMAILCWAKCATILVKQYAIRSWDFYFRFGKEDIRLSLPINTRHTLSMHFFIALLQEASESYSSSRVKASITFGEDEEEIYGSNLTEIWTCLLINVLEIQDLKATTTFLQLVNQFERKRTSTSIQDSYPSIPFNLEDEQEDSTIMIMLQSENRFEFLSNIISCLSTVTQQSSKLQKVVISTFSAVFSFVRQFISQNSKLIILNQNGNRLKIYLRFLSDCNKFFDQPLARALAIDLRNTQAVVQQHLDQVPQSM